MNIKRFFNRMLKFRVFKFVLFIMVNLILIYSVSFMLWASIDTYPECAGVGIWVSPEIPCPTWSWSITYDTFSFIEIFIMCSIMYFGMILIIFVCVLLNHHYITKRIDQ